MKHLIETHLKPILDWDTVKVLGAATGGIVGSLTIDGVLHTIISILTICYLSTKLYRLYKSKKDDDEV